jgi:diguanylate cyclase (GGDEF)-like protein
LRVQAILAKPSSGAVSQLGKGLLWVAGLAAGTHVVTLLLESNPIASNTEQMFASLIAVAACLLRGHESRTPHQRRQWLQLAGAFIIWTLAQALYTTHLLMHEVPAPPSLEDALWLMFAYPLLLVAAQPSSDSRLEPIGWIDALQAVLLFSILIALVFDKPGDISLGYAYDVQSLAMVMMVALRYSTTRDEPQRRFFRDLLCYALLYAVFSILGYFGLSHHFQEGGPVDLCWSAPFLIFSVLVLTHKGIGAQRWARRRPSANLLSLSALGLAGMSIVAAGVLARHSPWWGTVSTVLACTLLALRIYLREGQLREAQRNLEVAAYYDPLTGLPNREKLKQELAKCFTGDASQANRPGALLFLDLDRFKTVNDGLGHSFGDSILVEMAQRMDRVVGWRGLVGRYGGDEFVVLAYTAEPGAIKELTDELLETIRKPIVLDGRSVYLSASIGIVMGTETSSPADLLRDADCAMYQAKSLGKDRAEMFLPSMRSAVEQKLQLEADLHHALQAQSLEVQYQPIYALPACEIVGFEALVRWNHPERGMVSPADFIPTAEETGMILQLGQLVLRDACFRLQAWNAAFETTLTVNVNVSARQFDDPRLLESIANALHDAELAPSLLKLEITESALLTANPSVLTVLTGAREMGIEICLDDFGTGYSSLRYLLDYPFDVVKIDQSFVRNLDHDPARAELVRMVIELATNLNKQVIAEGIESEAEITRLAKLRCHMVQGYLLSRPLDPAVIGDLLEELLPHRSAAIREASRENHTPAQMLSAGSLDRLKMN